MEKCVKTHTSNAKSTNIQNNLRNVEHKNTTRANVQAKVNRIQKRKVTNENTKNTKVQKHKIKKLQRIQKCKNITIQRYISSQPTEHTKATTIQKHNTQTTERIHIQAVQKYKKYKY